VTGYSYGGEQAIGYVQSDTSMKVVAPVYNPSYSDIPFSDQVIDNQNKSLGFYLTIPIFSGLQARTNISKAKIGIENARLSLELTKNQLNQDIQRSYSDAVAAINKYQSAKKAKEAMAEAFFYMQQKFDVGLVNSVDYNEAKKNLSKAESEMLQAKYEYVFKRTILDFYMGKPIDL
jgi:outer membrane protein